MRRSDKEVKDKKFIESILQEADHCVLALSDDNSPYIVPMNFAYQDNTLYLHSSKEGRKIEILKLNPQVSFGVEIKTELVKSKSPCNYGMKYKSVSGFGYAYFIEDYNEKIEALNIMMDKYSCDESGEVRRYDYSEHMLDEIVVIKIKINRLTCKVSGY